jgi:hypothetical protein
LLGNGLKALVGVAELIVFELSLPGRLAAGCARWYSWRWAMMRTAKLSTVDADIRSAFLEVWVESKMLPNKVGDNRALARALRILMPGDYRGAPIKLYRGAEWRERCRHSYGFSWTRHKAMSRGFAEHWQEASRNLKARGIPQNRFNEGVVLGAVAPAEAILLIRDDEDYYDEGEIVVDPFKLPSVTVVERLS